MKISVPKFPAPFPGSLVGRATARINRLIAERGSESDAGPQACAKRWSDFDFAWRLLISAAVSGVVPFLVALVLIATLAGSICMAAHLGTGGLCHRAHEDLGDGVGGDVAELLAERRSPSLCPAKSLP